jgi:FtsP/CotA-like multicopper oxidase with cupredoxin domain
MPVAVALPPAASTSVLRLADGDRVFLHTRTVSRRFGGAPTAAYAFNGQLAGPTLDVDQGARVQVDFTNGVPLPTAIHWHGLRLDYRSDGVPGLTQPLLRAGDRFSYELRFPDAGIFWYHPHYREDIGMDLGLYGNIRVRPADPAYYNPVDREYLWMLDDVLVQDGAPMAYGGESANFMLMGRFGNVHLVNGVAGYTETLPRGSVARFFLTNASNARTYNLSFGDLPIKLIATDAGRFERETFVESVVIAPSERYTVEVRFPEAGRVAVVNAVQAIDHLLGNFFAEVDTLAVLAIQDAPAHPDRAAEFSALREHRAEQAEIAALRPYFDRPPDRELAIRLETTDLPPVVDQLMRFDAAFFNPVEWSDTMPMMNWASTGREIRWILEDTHTGKRNMDIDWRFAVGEHVVIQIRNERNGFHTMHHPIHFHGQRFLVLRRDGVPSDVLAWKDTMLLPAGVTADLLLEITNPGVWMAHCHIAEHIDSGMMFVFRVD